MMARILEVCVDSVQSAVNADKGGANRIELCSALTLGGLTPSLGLLKAVKRYTKCPVFCMLRPRQGDFVYTEEELEVVLFDITALAEADGFVFGALTNDGRVHHDVCSRVIAAAKGKPVTFHRAFDLCRDAKEALGDLFSLGFQRILTSGQQENALQGKETIKGLVEQAKGKISVMPGCGINEHNLRDIMDCTDAQEYHGSFSDVKQSLFSVATTVKMGKADDNDIRVTSSERVAKAVHVLKCC